MSAISVTIEKTDDGWVLQTADDFKDIIGGPFANKDEVRAAAKELNLYIIKQDKNVTVGSLPVGTLFRIDDHWYRLQQHSGKKSIVYIVGESVDKRTDTIQASTAVSQISVLSLK